MTGLTHDDLRVFVDALVRGLDETVLAHEIVGLHSEDIAEDGRTVRLFDLVGGRTGVQVVDGGKCGSVRYVD